VAKTHWRENNKSFQVKGERYRIVVKMLSTNWLLCPIFAQNSSDGSS